MSTFTLSISCLTTSNLPWFTDLTFQVPMQYCSFQHQTLLLSPVTSTTGHCFCFGSIPSFFLELFLHWSPLAYWATTDLGSSSFSILSFCLFILFMGFSRQELKWFAIPFSSGPPLPITQEKTLHMDITRWSTPKSDWLYPLQPKMEKLYTVNNNKKKDQELTVAQIMNFLLPNSDLNWRK